jgi:hypothetical protein
MFYITGLTMLKRFSGGSQEGIQGKKGVGVEVKM